MQTGMYIGTSPEAVAATREALALILNSPNAEKVKVAAIKALSNLCSVSNMTVSHCHIVGDTSHQHTHYESEPEGEPDEYEADNERPDE